MKKLLRTLIPAVLAFVASPICAFAITPSCTAVDPYDVGCNAYAGNSALANNSLFANNNGCGNTCNGQSLWNFGGWTEAGLYVNQYGQTNAYNANGFDPLSGNTQLLNNVRQSDLQSNQTWLFLEKRRAAHGLSVGGRVDAMYGTDGRFLQSVGLEKKDYSAGATHWGSGDYYLALPQMYAEIGYDNVSLKAGKFLSLLGYESAMSPERFFYSLSYAYAANPAVMTGVVGNWDVNRKVSVFGGWINGTDQFFYDGDNNAFVGGIKTKLGTRGSLSYGALYGKEKPWYLDNTTNREYFQHSLVFNYKPNHCWDYVLEWTLRNEDATQYHGHWGAYGLNNELIYNINCKWAVGFRGEWMHTYGDGIASIYGIPYNISDADVYAFTLAANWRPSTWLTVRPEIRYDKVDGAAPFCVVKSGGTGAKDHQLSGGFSVIVEF